MAVVSDIQGQNWLVPSKQTNSEDLTAGRERSGLLCSSAYINSANSDWRGATKHAPSQRPSQTAPNSCTYEIQGMRNQSHTETYRNPQPGNDQSKAGKLTFIGPCIVIHPYNKSQ